MRTVVNISAKTTRKIVNKLSVCLSKPVAKNRFLTFNQKLIKTVLKVIKLSFQIVSEDRTINKTSTILMF